MLTLGNDYSVFNKKIQKRYLVQNSKQYWLEENKDLSRNNQIGSKTSNLLRLLFNPNDFIKTRYNTSIKNNLTDINYKI